MGKDNKTECRLRIIARKMSNVNERTHTHKSFSVTLPLEFPCNGVINMFEMCKNDSRKITQQNEQLASSTLLRLKMHPLFVLHATRTDCERRHVCSRWGIPTPFPCLALSCGAISWLISVRLFDFSHGIHVFMGV